MLNKSHNPNILNDVMKVLRGETKEKKNLPQSLKDAAVSAAKDIRVLMEGVASAEYKRDTIRVHLHEGLKGCGCQPSVELINDFQDEVEQNLRKPVATEAADPKPLETPASVAKKTKSPVGSGAKMPVNTGLRGTKSNPKNIGEEVEESLKDFVSALTEEEIDYLKNIIEEQKMGKKQLENAVNDAYRKYFDRVQVDMMSITKIYKEIETAIIVGADLNTVMPELIKKYRRN